MKKQTLNEQVSRIKGMMKMNEDMEPQLNEFGGYGFKKGDDKDIEWLIQNRMEPAFKKSFSPLERFYMPLDDEKKLYSYIKSNIDRDIIQDTIAYMKELIKKDKVEKYIQSKKMKIDEDMEPQMEDQQITSVDEVIDYITEFSSRMEELAEEFREKLDGTEYWSYVKPMYSGIRSVSDMEGQYTRNDDQKGENVSNVIELIKSDEEMDGRSSMEDENREPSDDDIYNGFGREGGISYGTGDSWQGR